MQTSHRRILQLMRTVDALQDKCNLLQQKGQDVEHAKNEEELFLNKRILHLVNELESARK